MGSHSLKLYGCIHGLFLSGFIICRVEEMKWPIRALLQTAGGWRHAETGFYCKPVSGLVSFRDEIVTTSHSELS